ncbi:recombinase family protein [Burkholderia diffusa]|uniref:recombinase family protein n=1 Tax=Burkholderia diffusa TaxID=488732 RepID=UPI0022A9F7F2|nr:recombinase family protein [Burkholderia diffusa]
MRWRRRRSALPRCLTPCSQWTRRHHLLELCGLVEARVIDLDGVYDPCRANDRLLLGMKGSISEFELNVLRTRMHDAKREKAHRGELRISVPVGYI